MRLVRRKSRRSEPVEKLQLEQVIGLTSSSANGLACNPATGDIAYLAGCVVVVFNTVKKMQTKFLMVFRTPKALACVTYSPHGGKLIAAGECGHQPAIVVWDACDGTCVAELKAHKYGISCVRFSPNGKHLLSVGFPHDGQICIFDYKTGMLVSKLKAMTASSPIQEIQFASDGSFFVTAGGNQLSNWTIHSGRSKPSQGTGTHTLECRNINLGSLNENSFAAVASLEDVKETGETKEIQPIYAVTSAGILCMLHRGLAVKKWVNLKVRQAHSLCISQLHIACACSDGTVRIFMIESLAYGTTLPRPAPLGFHDLTDANTALYFAMNNVNGITYPDAIACRFSTPAVLAVLYMDHSFFLWDIQDFSKVLKIHSILPHSGCIWDVVNVSSDIDRISMSTCDSVSTKGENYLMGTFATCSSDGSIKVWSIPSQLDEEPNINNNDESPGNVYDQNLCGVLYQERQAESGVKARFPDNAESADSCKGFRSISTSADGHYLAAGDRSGNLYIYDLHSLQIISCKEAHDAEILTLSFGTVDAVTGDNRNMDVLLLASGGRDRLVHIYDARRNFEVIETRDDHSASVTAARFACNGSKLLSSSADKSVVFCSIEVCPLGFKSTRYHQEMASRGTVYDMDIDPSRKLAVTVSQDKKINFLSLETGKSMKSIKPDGESGEPIKVRVDPTGTCLVCSHSDKALRIYDISSGDLISSGQGHAEVITGVVFMHDCKRLVSVSGDSCIFIWKLPNSLSRMMRKRCILDSESSQLHAPNRSSEQSEKQEWTPNILEGKRVCAEGTHMHVERNGQGLTDATCNIPSAFKFSVSRLPHWAQAKVSETITDEGMDVLEEESIHSSESRWVERLGSEGYKLFCEPQLLTPPATILPNKLGLRRRFTIEPGGSCTSIHDTPESSSRSDFSEPSTSTPKVIRRKEDNWNTVHTLFYDEVGSVDEPHGHLFGQHRNDNDNCHLNHSNVGQETLCGKEDCTVVYRSENEREVVPKTQGIFKGSAQLLCQTPVPLACMVNSRSDRSMSLYFRSTSQDDRGNRLESLTGNLKNNKLNGDFHGEQYVQSSNEEMSDDESEQHFDSDGGMFDAHFSNLSTVVKAGHVSTRSSFSARFFSQSNHTLPVISLFQESPKVDTKQITEVRATSEVVTVEDQELQRDSLQVMIDTTHFNLIAEKISIDVKEKLELHQIHEEKQPHLDTSNVNPADEVFKDGKDEIELQQTGEHKQGLLISSPVPGSETVKDIASNNRCDAPTIIESDLQVSPSMLLSTDLAPGFLNQVSQSCEPLADSPAFCSASEGLVQKRECFNDAKQEICVDGQSQYDIPTESDFLCDVAVETSFPKIRKPLDLFKQVLQDLSQAADNALATYEELDSVNKAEVFNLYEEFVSPTLQKILQLSDTMSSNQTRTYDASAPDNRPSIESGSTSCSDHSPLRISNTGTITSRPYFAPSMSAASSALESIDIEGFVQNYSARFSEILASQVLALVEKGLNSKQ